jgi:hypothetical protein
MSAMPSCGVLVPTLGLHVGVVVLGWRRVHPWLQLQTHLDQAAGVDLTETEWCVW